MEFSMSLQHNSTSRPPLAWVVSRLAPRLHPAGLGAACSCGPCRHQIRLAAEATGHDEAALRKAVGLVEELAVKPEPVRRRTGLTGQIGVSARLVVGGRRCNFVEAADALLKIAAGRR